MHKRLLPVLIVLALSSMACNLSDLLVTRQAGPTATPAPTETATPIPTPTLAPTPLPAVRIQRAGQALENGDPEKARNQFQAALDSTDDFEARAAAQLGLARTFLIERDCDQAVPLLQQVTGEYVESASAPVAFFLLGDCYDQQEKYSEAAAAYGKYLEFQPGVLDSFMQERRGDALAAAGDQQAALDAYQAARQAPHDGDNTAIDVKIGKLYSSMNDYENALRTYLAVYDATTNEYTKAQMNLLAGQTYLALGYPQQAFARFQDSVANYPRAYDSYSGLVALVNAGEPVSDLDRGLVDYFAGQYGFALDALTRYIENTPDHDGTAHQYKALTLRATENYEAAVKEWDELIRGHRGDRYWPTAWDEKTNTLWLYLDRPEQAIQVELDYVKQVPADPGVAQFLFDAARIQERTGKLKQAAATWERMIDEYPSDALSYRGLFLSAITNYRLKEYEQAQTQFQRLLVLGADAVDQSAANFWIGKTLEAQGKTDEARAAWQETAKRDPTGYYSERANELLNGESPMQAPVSYDLGVDMAAERRGAEEWLRSTFSIPAETNLSGLGELANNEYIQRGDALVELGLLTEARAEFEEVRTQMTNDPLGNYRLMNHLLERGFYRQAILISRQILALAGMDDTATLSAPAYFNHIRFGAFFREVVTGAAKDEGFHPLFLFSVIRQESLFEGFVQSSAGARGLMQIMPATGREIVSTAGWPPNYQDVDLYRPQVNIGLGARYLARQRDLFDGDIYAALAAYNGGPGNAQVWKQASGDDPDLFLEVIRYDETRTYIMHIAEFMNIYRLMYQRK